MNDMEGEAFLAAVMSSRGSAAELKLQLVNLRAEIDDSLIFIFEGDDDRGVFFSWTRYLDPEFRYEPFTCRGKDQVLKLRAAVERDAGSLRTGLYYFIDRDFDDARGESIDESIYMTDFYSIENYLVNEHVLEEVLKIEYHCHAMPAIRAGVVGEFRRLYDKFLEVTVDVNRRLYVARRIPLELMSQLPNQIGRLVTVSLHDVQRSNFSSAELVSTQRDISDEEWAAYDADFQSLDRERRFRGKFSMMFFMKWLELLAVERKEQTTNLFLGTRADVKVHFSRLSTIALASRSAPPESFREFFDRIPRATHCRG